MAKNERKGMRMAEESEGGGRGGGGKEGVRCWVSMAVEQFQFHYSHCLSPTSLLFLLLCLSGKQQRLRASLAITI